MVGVAAVGVVDGVVEADEVEVVGAVVAFAGVEVVAAVAVVAFLGEAVDR